MEKAVNDWRALWRFKNPSVSGHNIECTLLFFLFSLHVGLCQQNVHFLIIRSSKERRSCDTWPCHTHTHMFKQTCLWMYGLVALHLPPSPTAAWILTGWEECGNPHLWSCRVAASSSSPYIPCLSGFQPGLTCEPGRGPLALPTICLRWPNFETFDMSSCLRHSSFRHAAVCLSKSTFLIWRNIH